MNIPIETHPLAPFAPKNATLLMLGSFPPPQNKWKMQFYYPNFQNDMWRIFGLVFFNDSQHFINSTDKCFHESALRHFLEHIGIAISDTAYRVQRLQNNAADKFLHIIEPMPLMQLLKQLPYCQHIMTTGDKATETLLATLSPHTPAPKIGQSTTLSLNNRSITLHRLPSSSRAYPLSLEKKASLYRAFFQSINMLPSTISDT